MSKKQEMYDIAIIGGGVTGFAAAMYAGRMKLKTILIGFPPGGTIATTDWIENYPGFVSISGKELADKIEAHAREYAVEILFDNVTAIKRHGNSFLIQTAFAEYSAKTVLFATGARYRKLEVPGADEFENKGVQFCGLCDGPSFQGKHIAVVGGGDTAAKEALLLTQWVERVYLIFRGKLLKGEPINVERVEANDKITTINQTKIMRIEGKKGIEKVALDRPYQGKNELSVKGVFIAIGSVPMSDLATRLGVEVNEQGEIIINRRSETNIPGLYAAGDVTNTEFKQAITGVAEGVTAIYHAYKYISGEFVDTYSDSDYNDCPASPEDQRNRPN